MQKELESIGQLESRRNKLLSILEEGKAVVGSREVRSERMKKEEVGSSFEATLGYGRYNKATGIVIRTVDRLQGRLTQLDQQIEPIVRQHATSYLNDLNLKRYQLAEMSVLVAEGNLPEDVLGLHQREYETFASLPETNPLLKRAIERVRQEEEEKKKESKSEAEVSAYPFGDALIMIQEDPIKIRLSNNRIVRGDVAKLLDVLARKSSVDMPMPIQDIAEQVFQDRSYEEVRNALGMLIHRSRESLIGSGLELINAVSAQERFKKKKSSYYLKVSEEGFRFEDGEVVAGEAGKLLKKLSPFDHHHIVSNQELLEEGTFNQYLQEAKSTLFAKGFRLAQIPNLKDPDNVGFYVETYRPPAKITVLGDTIRYKDKEGQEKQIRLTEEQRNLLWDLSSGEPKIPSLELLNAVSSLNTVLAKVTGVKEAIVCVGDENFGYWYKVKDISITCRVRYLPLYPSRKEALELIFQDDNATKDRIINTLGPTRGIKREARLLDGRQALIALARSVVRLTNRMSENIAEEEEAEIFQKMQKYMAKHNLKDRRELIDHLREKLGVPPRTSTIDTDNTDLGDDDLSQGIAGDVDGDIERTSIDTPEFGNLSKEEVALMAIILKSRKEQIVPFLQQRGITFINDDILHGLTSLVDGFRPEGLSDMNSKQISQAMIDYKIKTLEKVKAMIKDSRFDAILEEIYQDNPNVWEMLIDISDINQVIEGAGREEGILLLAQKPEELEKIFSHLQKETPKDADEVTIFPPEKQNGQSISPLEKRDPDIRAKVNQYLNQILAIRELNGPVSPSMVTRFFPRIKAKTIDQCVKEGWVRGLPAQGKRRGPDHFRFDAVSITTLRYLYANEDNLTPQLKKQVQDIALEEYTKRRKEKEEL